jgi:hypothetical protein
MRKACLDLIGVTIPTVRKMNRVKCIYEALQSKHLHAENLGRFQDSL